MIRKKFIITLTNIKKNQPDLTIEIVADKLKAIGNGHIIISKEHHKGGEDYHYHIIFIIEGVGISKNIYHSVFDNLFPRFTTGYCIRREGIKSIKKAIRYIIKGINPKLIIKFIKDSQLNNWFYTNISCEEFKSITKGVEGVDRLVTVISILEFQTFDEWAVGNIENLTKSTRNKGHNLTLWSLSRLLIPIPGCLNELVNEDYTIDELKTKVNNLKKKLGWSEVHEHFIIQLIQILLCREGIYGFIPKSKSIYLVGQPNVGKTRLLNKIMDALGEEVFYHRGNRAGDFTGFNPNFKPIIVIDDVISRNSRWDFRTLLKLLAREIKYGDVKYGPLVKLAYRGVIIVSNHGKLFGNNDAIQARLKKYVFYKEVKWFKLSNEEIKIILAYYARHMIYINKNYCNEVNHICIGEYDYTHKELLHMPDIYSYDV